MSKLFIYVAFRIMAISRQEEARNLNSLKKKDFNKGSYVRNSPPRTVTSLPRDCHHIQNHCQQIEAICDFFIRDGIAAMSTLRTIGLL